MRTDGERRARAEQRAQIVSFRVFMGESAPQFRLIKRDCFQRLIYPWGHVGATNVGNKCDREDRKVQTEKAKKWCGEHGDLKLFETSAKNEIGVEESFKAIAKLAGAREKEEEM